MEPISALIALMLAYPSAVAAAAGTLGLTGLVMALQLGTLDPGDPDSVIEHLAIVVDQAHQDGVEESLIHSKCVVPQRSVRYAALAGKFDARLGAGIYERCAKILPIKAEPGG